MPAELARVAEFTRRHLETIEDLQVLIVCMDDADRWWSPDSMARHLALTPGHARRVLDRLVRSNLCDIRVGGEVKYRFSPGTPQLESDASAWLAEYRRNPLSVVTLLTGRRSLRDFADAFRIKRRDTR